MPTLLSRGETELTRGRPDYEVEFKDLIKFFERKWVPLPLLREELDKPHCEGPLNWARIYVVSLGHEHDAKGNDHRLVLALDTGLIKPDMDDWYLAPTPDDARNGRKFSIPRQRNYYNFYLREPWVRGWLDEMFREECEETKRRELKRREVDLTDAEIEEMKQGPNEPIARYMALLDLLNELECIPKVALADTVTAERPEYVDVDMVADLGNSRTCVLLMEAEPGNRAVELSQATRLQLRDLSQPEQVHDKPFESQCEFSYAKFGRDRHSFASGRADAFVWPTIVRVGPEAVRLASARGGTRGRTGLSSPKRYLWDEDPSQESWRFSGLGANGQVDECAAQGPFAHLVNDVGKALHLAAADGEDDLGSLHAKYARSHLVTFVLAEVFLQALVWMNAPAHRNERNNTANMPRRLRRIILTMPTALSLAERQILRDRAEAARDLVYLCMGLVPKNRDGSPKWGSTPPPEIVLKWDEASATQVVYLYHQIACAFSGDAQAFFASLGHTGAEASKLRLATLDIGGGTSDLVVTELTAEGAGAHVTLYPKQLFRESFSLAGDDIVYMLARDIVVASFRGAVAAMPGFTRDRADALMQRLFGGDRGDMKIEEHQRRRLFATQIAAPAAVSILSAYEGFDVVRPSAAKIVPLGELLTGNQPPPGVVEAVEREVVDAGGDASFKLLDLPIPVDLVDVDSRVRSLMGDMLRALNEVAWRYNVSLFLLSGRPSRFPAIRDVIVETGSIPPHRVISMHGLRVGNWYSFRDAEARISDPKTTAAVGGMICLLAEGHLNNFNFRSENLKTRSVARFLGKIDNNGTIGERDIYYSNLDFEAEYPEMPDKTFEFRGPMLLGVRQFENEWWPASLLYALDYESEEDRRELQKKTPIELQLYIDKKPRLGKEDVFNDRLIIKKRGLRMRLQTLRVRDGYWLDTGVLIDV